MDYYGILGVPRTASQSEIQQAFREFALKFHPDRFANASPSEKEFASAKFKEASEAYKVLNNAHDRSIYDRSGRSAVHRARQSHTSSHGSHTSYQNYGSSHGWYRHNPNPHAKYARWARTAYPSWSDFSARQGRYMALHTAAGSALLFVMFAMSSSAEWIWNTVNDGRTFEDAMHVVQKRAEEQKQIEQQLMEQEQKTQTEKEAKVVEEQDAQIETNQKDTEAHANHVQQKDPSSD